MNEILLKEIIKAQKESNDNGFILDSQKTEEFIAHIQTNYPNADNIIIINELSKYTSDLIDQYQSKIKDAARFIIDALNLNPSDFMLFDLKADCDRIVLLTWKDIKENWMTERKKYRSVNEFLLSSAKDNTEKYLAHRNIEHIKEVIQKHINYLFYTENYGGNMNLQDKEDCISKAYINYAKILKKNNIDYSKGLSSADAYIGKTCQNLVIDTYKKKKKIIPSPDPIDNNTAESVNLNVVQVHTVLDLMEIKYSQVLKYKYIYGYTAEEIANILNVKKSTVDSRMQKAKIIFKKKYEDLFK